MSAEPCIALSEVIKRLGTGCIAMDDEMSIR